MDVRGTIVNFQVKEVKPPHGQARVTKLKDWGTVGLAVVVALFAGSFLGNLFASRRRPPPRPSIYAAVQRRMEEERAKG